ncbi:uncharacterized protein JCM15063_003986 [Sporobolomyces koalae]|uniref:uncharacterized protein n=1 Tax=Sporobolomyces koalae TaxID=500713 RepID=UPI003172C544
MLANGLIYRTIADSRAVKAESSSDSKSSNKSMKSIFRLPFGSKKSSSPSIVTERDELLPKPAKAPVDVFAQIMALNARHGDPSVQAYAVKTPKQSKKKSSKLVSTRTVEAPPPPYDAFDEIMRINARHGHPSVQAHFAR